MKLKYNYTEIIIFVFLCNSICVLRADEYCQQCRDLNEYVAPVKFMVNLCPSDVQTNQYPSSFRNVSTYLCQTLPDLNESCDPGVGCIGQYICVNSKCTARFFKSNGDSCADSQECVSLRCTNGRCAAQESNCQHQWECEVGNYCTGRVGSPGTCVPFGGVGSSCDPSKKLEDCEYGLFCSLTGLCTPLFSLQNGDHCASQTQCNYSAGLYCAFGGICRQYNLTQGSCAIDRFKCNNNEWCSCMIDHCVTIDPITTDNANSQLALWSCLKANNCSDKLHYNAQWTRESCAMVKCSQEFCAAQKYKNERCKGSIEANLLCATYTPTIIPIVASSNWSSKSTPSLLFTSVVLAIVISIFF